MTTTQNLLPEAYIAVGGNRQKIYSNAKIYLNGGTEFQIELFNPTQGVVAAKIYINDEPISTSLIVLRPGVREYLDRYIDNNKKFLFDTYKVEDTKESKEAIANNGNVRVEFFKAVVQSNITIYPTFVWPGISGAPQTPPYWTQPWCGDDLTNGDYKANFFSQKISASNNIQSSLTNFTSDVHDGAACMDNLSFTEENINEEIETGRIEGGNASDQNFVNYNGEFEPFTCISHDYQILPTSTKPVEVSKIRQYCPECRNRIRKSSWKFCPSCGETLD